MIIDEIDIKTERELDDEIRELEAKAILILRIKEKREKRDKLKRYIETSEYLDEHIL